MNSNPDKVNYPAAVGDRGIPKLVFFSTLVVIKICVCFGWMEIFFILIWDWDDFFLWGDNRKLWLTWPGGRACLLGGS